MVNRLPEDNVRRFRNRLRGLRDRYRAGTVTREEVIARVNGWIGHALHAHTWWRLRHTLFRGGWFDSPLSPEVLFPRDPWRRLEQQTAERAFGKSQQEHV